LIQMVGVPKSRCVGYKNYVQVSLRFIVYVNDPTSQTDPEQWSGMY
jgi:hypothetical protein